MWSKTSSSFPCVLQSAVWGWFIQNSSASSSSSSSHTCSESCQHLSQHLPASRTCLVAMATRSASPKSLHISPQRGRRLFGNLRGQNVTIGKFRGQYVITGSFRE
ncbi:hypothetical protein ACOMHN_048284 [Nucella lapillus]